MRKILGGGFIAALISLSPNCWADLTNPTYLSAKQAYAQQRWTEARQLLDQYKSEDASFLTVNRSILDAINDAIGFCYSKMPHASNPGATRIFAGGIIVAGGAAPASAAPPAQPVLPQAPQSLSRFPSFAPTSPAYPSNFGMLVCGCYGTNPPLTAPEPRCQSGSVRLNQCPVSCANGGMAYAYVCM
jgi:hypothetical protein